MRPGLKLSESLGLIFRYGRGYQDEPNAYVYPVASLSFLKGTLQRCNFPIRNSTCLVHQRVLTKSFVVLILGHSGAQGTFNNQLVLTPPQVSTA